MRCRWRAGWLVAVTVGALGVGCGDGADVPEHPTWAKNVRPLLVARCVRCHDDPCRVDPASPYSVALGPNACDDFNYPTFEDIPHTTSDDVLSALQQASYYVRSGMMPPAPAAALLDWQVEILDRWCANPM